VHVVADISPGPRDGQALMSDLWTAALRRIARTIGQKSFRDWFEPTELHSLDRDEVRVAVPNVLIKEWLERNFRDVVEEVLVELAAESPEPNAIPRKVRFLAPHEAETLAPAARPSQGSALPAPLPDGPLAAPPPPRPTLVPPPEPRTRPLRPARSGRSAPPPPASVPEELAGAPSLPPREIQVHAGLDPRYTFDNFIVGSCNQFAHAAARAVADAPGRSYNPLFLYGGVGLGKTHLMHAIGHAALADRPNTRIAYVSAERFMCEMVNAIRWKRTHEFREKFRSTDLLLVDDVQFLEGKEATQEEFFHTFRTLYETGKQIVLSSDCPPRELKTLEERLRSRFESGLSADMQSPDLETKLAILRRKTDSEGGQLSDDVALYIANKVRSNVRELEGCLTRLLALSSLRHRTPDVELAREATRDIFPDDDKPVTVEVIQRFVADYYNVKVSDLKARNNSRTVAFPRQVAMYLCKKMTTSSFPDIGKKFGGKHHSTVIHSVNKISAEAARSDELHRLLNRFMESIH
jgi:chromosomal replication initiator protein